MSTTSKGRDAEKQVANNLVRDGHKIINLNWRTRWCEIDIVSTKSKCVYFTEVKYRSSSEWGGGLEYITPTKLKQMKFAAEFWVSENDWKNDISIQAAEVDYENRVNIIEIF